MNNELMAWLGETTLATSAALLLVLLLRRPMRTAFGSGAAYALWALVPIALIAVLLPAPMHPVVLMPMAAKIGVMQTVAAAPVESSVPWVLALIAAWAAGAVAMATLQLWQQRRFLRHLGPLRIHAHGLRVAATSDGLPAVTGVLRPRIVLPADFLARYDADERALVVAHERQHIARGDLPCNALVALLRCVYWFNPLLCLAVARYRHDQELACDARVLQRHPHARRAYARAMLKTQLDDFALPVGCHWHTHPIKERIAMLKRPSPRRWQTGLSSALLLALFAGVGYAAWAQQPTAPGASVSANPSPTQYGAALQVDVDGERHTFEMHSAAYLPFSFSLDTKSRHHWEGTLSVEPSVQGQAKVHMVLKRDGADVANPMIITRFGEDASIQVEPGAGDRETGAEFSLSMRIRELAQQASTPSAHQENPAPQPQMQQVADKQPAVAADAKSFDYSQHQPPHYPKAAADARITGHVVMLVDVAANGDVNDAQIERAEPAGIFEAVSLEAVRKWKFMPVLKHGKPVAHRVRVPIDFDMDPPAEKPNGGSAQDGGIAWYKPDPNAQGTWQFSCDATRGILSDSNPADCGTKQPSAKKGGQAVARTFVFDVNDAVPAPPGFLGAR